MTINLVNTLSDSMTSVVEIVKAVEAAVAANKGASVGVDAMAIAEGLFADAAFKTSIVALISDVGL